MSSHRVILKIMSCSKCPSFCLVNTTKLAFRIVNCGLSEVSYCKIVGNTTPAHTFCRVSNSIESDEDWCCYKTRIVHRMYVFYVGLFCFFTWHFLNGLEQQQINTSADLRTLPSVCVLMCVVSSHSSQIPPCTRQCRWWRAQPLFRLGCWAEVAQLRWQVVDRVIVLTG